MARYWLAVFQEGQLPRSAREHRIYRTFLGIDEVDLDRGYISWRSPLANALMKASSGDRVDLRAPV